MDPETYFLLMKKILLLFVLVSVSLCTSLDGMQKELQLTRTLSPEIWSHVAQYLPANNNFLNRLCRLIVLPKKEYERICKALIETEFYPLPDEKQYVMDKYFKTCAHTIKMHIQKALQDVIQRHPITKQGQLSTLIHIWPLLSPTGREILQLDPPNEAQEKLQKKIENLKADCAGLAAGLRVLNRLLSFMPFYETVRRITHRPQINKHNYIIHTAMAISFLIVIHLILNETILRSLWYDRPFYFNPKYYSLLAWIVPGICMEMAAVRTNFQEPGAVHTWMVNSCFLSIAMYTFLIAYIINIPTTLKLNAYRSQNAASARDCEILEQRTGSANINIVELANRYKTEINALQNALITLQQNQNEQHSTK